LTIRYIRGDRDPRSRAVPNRTVSFRLAATSCAAQERREGGIGVAKECRVSSRSHSAINALCRVDMFIINANALNIEILDGTGGTMKIVKFVGRMIKLYFVTL
jgi:hypothetical protein